MNDSYFGRCLHCNGLGVVADNGDAVRIECIECGSSTRWCRYEAEGLSSYYSRRAAVIEAMDAWNKKYLPMEE